MIDPKTEHGSFYGHEDRGKKTKDEVNGGSKGEKKKQWLSKKQVNMSIGLVVSDS